MAGFYNLDHKEVIRIKVKKCDGKMQPEYKKFSIDPQITSFEMLQGILAKAFEIGSDFTISYLARDSEGQAVYLSMLSDWDMDAAFQCAADPCLKLKVDLRPFEEEMEDWDVIAPAEIPQHRISSLLDKNSLLGSITGTISHNFGKTVTSMQRAMGFKQTENEVIKPLKPPMSDMEFHNYLDSAGYMIKPNEFRLSIYQGGIETSLRRVAWRHLLNIFPSMMSGKDRFDYMKRKEEEYRKLRDEWRDKFRNNSATEEVKYVAGMVKKDVLRTDRSHGFYAGNDENENTLALFHILVTYALTHPDVSYCQGMSDLASPVLLTQKDEAQAYICFCALMNRLRDNFTIEGTAIMTKFRHLSELLGMYDPELYSFLLQNSAGDMFFCYRWFLLELKREFPFTDALYVLEVMWATLPPSPPTVELTLADTDYNSRLLSSSPCSPTFSFQQAMYAKLLAMRRVGVMHRVTQSALPISSTTPRASANNNSSTEELPGSGDVNVINSSVVSSFDTSPGDVDDRAGEFPEVDSPMVRSMQRKSNSIDQVLQEAVLTSGEHKDSQEEKDLEGVVDDEQETLSKGIDISLQREKPCAVEAVSLVDRIAEQSWLPGESFDLHVSPRDELDPSYDSTESSSQTSEQQVQFSLSLDSNANNSVEVLSLPSEPEAPGNTLDPEVGKLGQRNNVVFIKSEQLETGAATEADSSSGLFQSMKRLLSSPKRRHSSSATPEAQASPKTSPKKPVTGGFESKHCESTPVLPTSSLAEGELVKNYSESHLSDCQEAKEPEAGSVSSCDSGIKPPVRDPSKLPPPQEFGAGNPFLMFLCLTLLTQHRSIIIEGGMCYEEIAMHFDRLVRRHNAGRVLHQARQFYTEYLRCQQANLERQKDAEILGSSC